MTQKGEQMTPKGEIKDRPFYGSRDLAIGYSKKNTALSAEQGAILLQEQVNHRGYQMIFVLKGKLSFDEDGQASTLPLLESQQYNLLWSSGKSAFPKGLADESNEIVFVEISPDFLSRYLPDDHPAAIHLQSEQEATTNPVILFSSQHLHITPEINAILNGIENSPHTGFCERLFLESKVIELLAIKISQLELLQQQPSPRLKQEELDKMQEAREILIQNIDRPFSLRTLAHMVGTNEFNLKKQFKAVYGNTVYGYLNQYKMEQAKAMLLQGDSRISEVSEKMGYKHATHFTSAFKKYFGYLPHKIKMFVLLFDPEICLVLFTT
ncbi:helix-turn-helix transcriptional regulator [Pedobacter gandavensis]|uniref:Helix-turn-helix domain-containing protein n=1 Tax=Pedobacter gandavensis TaxID=2679963 RepID=A0ABR6F084_9SPHI|nr:AraC family transcriptional regulator [Pedobacter gandavensis]MBB2150922.1 helix-turn-helix domain-containing protein [Pedobacter gandavensis]